MKILITRRINSDAVNMIKQQFEIDYIDENKPLDYEYLFYNINNYDGILSCITEKFDKKILERARNRLKVISNMAIGLDNIDILSALELGITVFNTPDVVTESTADMTLALGLAINRKINVANDFVKSGNWKGWDPELFLGRTLSKLNWGIIGYGRIGQAVAKRVVAFGSNVLFFDNIFKNSNTENITYTNLKDLLTNSDIISIHIPLSEDNENFFNMNKFKIMKKDSILINMARGKIINSDDLIIALTNKIIGAAALDVFEPEPIPTNNPLIEMHNVILTPHIGTATEDCRKEMAINAANNIINFFKNV